MTMNRCGMLILTALLLLGTTLIAGAAPNARERDKCLGSCYSKCAAQHSCERPDAGPNCFTNFNQCKALCRSSCPR
jgi:hypothetical protein